MDIIEKAVSWISAIANDSSHGYDQQNRWGPDYDCSSLVISAWKQAGVSLSATYTGNMCADFTARGFQDVTVGVDLASGAGLERGDVLLNHASHTAMYIGNGQMVQASGNEWGGITGGQTGDQTGREIGMCGYYNFPWDCVLRYGAAPSAGETGDVYTVQPGDSLWSIAEKLLGSGTRWEEIMAANGLCSTVIHAGQRLSIPRDGSRTVVLTLRADVWEALERKAAQQNKTVEGLLEVLVAG